MTLTLSGYSFGKNLVKLGYPFVECILSALPICDEFVIGVATDSDDETAYWCKRLQRKFPDKVRLYEFTWPAITPTGTSIGAVQTEVLRQCRGWYAWCIQSDECYAPENLPIIRAAVEDARYEAFEVPFLHITSNYQSVLPLHTAAYNKAVRIVRTIDRISAHHDGWSFERFNSCHHLDLPTPVLHIGYEQPLNVAAKWWNHQFLYPDLPEYSRIAQEWREKVESGDFGPEFDAITSPFPLPPIIKGLVGTRIYKVREDLLRNPGKYVKGL